MKRSKQSNYLKIVAFVLIAIITVSALGFVANGWQPILNPEEGGENNDISPDDSENGGADIPVDATPKYYNYLTGLETNEGCANIAPIAFVTTPKKPLYGISSASLTVEFPIEGEDSRLLIFTDSATSLGKIGQIEPTRGYISNLARYFGGILLSYGDEDVIKYDSLSIANQHIDLTDISGFHYTEGKIAYSNGDLLQAALRTLGISLAFDTTPRLPFNFVQTEGPKLSFSVPCRSTIIPVDSSVSTKLLYNEESGRYSYCKNDVQITDSLNTAKIEYDNAFILLADSITYESVSGSELVVKTNERGRGYYLTNGSYTEVKWVTEGGTMTIYDENDNKLAVNRGVTYIAFVKSTQEQLIKFTH